MMDLIPPQLRLGLFLVVLAAVFAAGWTVRDWKADADRVAQLEAAEKAIRAQIKADRQIHDELAARLAASRQQRDTDYAKFQEALRNAKPTTLVRCNPTPAAAHTTTVNGPPQENEPAVGVAFSGEFVRLWNAGLSVGASEADRARRPTDTVERAGVSDPRTLLSNVGENGRRANACGAALNGWIDWACKHGLLEGPSCTGGA